MIDMQNTAPYARNNLASQQAGQRIEHKLTGIRARVFEAIVRAGRRGATCSEISDSTGILLLTVRPRCAELFKAGYILDSRNMRKNDIDSNETVWISRDGWPMEPFKADQKPKRQSGLDLFDAALRRNPHIRNAFRVGDIDIIRKELGNG